jgi:Bacterial membrane protein YfhO
MVSFAHGQHPQLPIDEVANVGEAGRFLASQAGLFRVYTDPRVEQPRANMLLPWQVAETRAYDPLELGRHRVLLGSAIYVDNWLSDLMGIRYRLLPADQPGQPSYRQTAFNPQHPLVSGGAFNPSGREVWAVPGDPADELRVVSALEGATGVAPGDKVAEWVLTDSRRQQTVLSMHAGRDTAEASYDDPVTRRPAHPRAEVAFSFELSNPLPSGARQVNLYYQALPLRSGPPMTRIEFRYTHPVGRMQVYGFALWNRSDGSVGQFYDREKYRLAFQDATALIYENQAAFPKAFAVPEAVQADSSYGALDVMAHGAFQPRRQIVLEPQDAEDQQVSPPAAPSSPAADDRLGQPYGDVQVVDYRNERVDVRAATDGGGYLVLTDAYYPGWKAYVDGKETRVLRADYLFRAVAVPPGEHLVEFRYQPQSFQIGRAISLAALAIAVVALGLSFIPTLRRPFYFLHAPKGVAYRVARDGADE